MINEIFGNYIVTYSLANYWHGVDITVIEVWPRKGVTVDIDTVQRFKEKMLND